MAPKEQAEKLIKKHLTAIAEESMDSDKIMFYNAKQCALVTVNMILDSNPNYPFPRDVGVKTQGLFKIINFPINYWEEVKNEIKQMTWQIVSMKVDPR